MKVILVWLGRQAPLLYLACALMAMLYAASAISARRKRDLAQFSLEREVFHRRMVRAWTTALLALILGGVIFAIDLFLVPELPAAPTPTPPTAGLTLPAPTPLGGSPLIATAVPTTPVVTEAGAMVTPSPTPPPSPTPLSPAEMQPDCPSPDAQITLPVAGSSVSGLVEIQGTARTNAFANYRFEVEFPGSDTPTFISQYNIPVENGPLGTWDVSDSTRYPPGTYRFRLVVSDIYGNTKTCIIPLNVAPPPETGP